MRANNVLGIIYASTYDQSLPELTNMRTMGSVPFGGRYRLIDFPLSNMVNSGISKVGVITKSNYRSLMDHLGTGKPWDLSRKREGMFILPPFNSAEDSGGLFANRIDALVGCASFISSSTNEYVLLCDCNTICNIDINLLFDAHEQSGADITPLWWAISLGACLGGNGSLIGASANVVLSGISNKNGYPITFMSYLKVGFPLMILSIIISTGFLLIRY